MSSFFATVPSAQSNTLYRRSSGQPLSIRDDNQIGSGGEGSIYALDEVPDLVAKVYHSPGTFIGAKLALMVNNPPTMPSGSGHVSIAWPVDTLHSALPATTQNTVGFLMHRINDMQPVNQCYNPAARKRNFPHYTYRHLCAAAINIAIAVNAVHGRNYVIGDINESNILIDDYGLITLIDTDSFQVIDQSDGTIYRSPVGKPEYTPRELQGHSFDSVDRDQYHDRFGLGVIIFQLLMEGRHPYTGRYTGLGEPPAIEANIAEGHFLHSASRRVPLTEGRGYVHWNTLDSSIAELFRLCFERGHDNQIVRPTAFQWEEAITQASDLLVTCARHSHHAYFGNNPTCPWCDRARMLQGRDPFPGLTGPEPLVMRAATPAGPSVPGGRVPPPTYARPQVHQLPRPRPQALIQRRFQQGLPSLRRLTLPSNSRSAWAALLLVVGGVSLISWGITSLFNFIDSYPFGRSPPIFEPPMGGSPGTLSQLPTLVPSPAPAFAQPLGTPTPTPTVVALSTPTPTPAVIILTTPPPIATPAPVDVPSAPHPAQASAVATLPAPTTTPTLTATPARGPILLKPDLGIESRSLYWEPKDHSVGDIVTFAITVVNDGGPAGSSSLMYSIFSVGLDTSLISHGVVEVPAIRAHESAVVSFEWSSGPGSYVFEFEVDPENQIEESNESDNLTTADNALFYPGPLLADLVVESIEWSPEAPVMGGTVTLSVTISNRGEGRAGSSTVRLHVGDEILGEIGIPPILAGESGTASFDWEAGVGELTIRAVSDSSGDVSETVEDNNEFTAAYQATTFVDLIVESVSWDPPNPSVGDEVSLTINVANQGSLDAIESTLELSIIPTNGTASSSRARVPEIAAGEAATATFRWWAQQGDFTLIAHADIDDMVVESDEANNEVERAYDSTLLADLVVTDIAWDPESPIHGEEVTIAVQLENRGEGSSLPTDAMLYVNDDQHGEPVSLPGVPPMGSHTVTFRWVATIGAHTFSALADHGERVTESDDTNNQSEVFVFDGTRVADLKVRSIDWSPKSPSVGDIVLFAVTLENRGGAPARDFHVSFEDASSVWPAMEKSSPSELSPGNTAIVNFEWPADAAPHEFVAVADSRDEVTESDEDNNDYSITYAATVVADLVVSRIASSPRNPSIDEDTSIKVTVRNEGPGGSGPFFVTLDVTAPDGVSDEYNRREDGLSAGASKALEFPWTARAGTHTFTAKADSRGAIAETDESNNVREDTVVTALADLTVAEVHFSSLNPSAGDIVEMRVLIANVGRGNSQRFAVELYVVGEDEPYNSVAIGFLERNATTYIEFSLRAEAGCHELIVITDAAGNIPEEDENNNRSQQYEICSVESQ